MGRKARGGYVMSAGGVVERERERESDVLEREKNKRT